jgi:hypothetical protein
MFKKSFLKYPLLLILSVFTLWSQDVYASNEKEIKDITKKEEKKIDISRKNIEMLNNIRINEKIVKKEKINITLDDI